MSASCVTSTELHKFENEGGARHQSIPLCIRDRSLQASVTVITDKDMCVRGTCGRDEKPASQV